RGPRRADPPSELEHGGRTSGSGGGDSRVHSGDNTKGQSRHEETPRPPRFRLCPRGVRAVLPGEKPDVLAGVSGWRRIRHLGEAPAVRADEEVPRYRNHNPVQAWSGCGRYMETYKRPDWLRPDQRRNEPAHHSAITLIGNI